MAQLALCSTEVILGFGAVALHVFSDDE